jgi:mRNA interferase RelE/StbE
VSQYTVYVTPGAPAEIRQLPGNMRQRVRRAISALAEQPRPSASTALIMPTSQAASEERVQAEVSEALELRRLRLDRWRIVYTVTDAGLAIDVLAVRRRPPYDYGDLAVLLRDV